MEAVTIAGASIVGYTNGVGLAAAFNAPNSVLLNPVDKCFYICDAINQVIRKMTRNGTIFPFYPFLRYVLFFTGDVSTFAAEKGDGQLGGPCGICLYRKEMSFFVTNCQTHCISKITSTGKST